MDKKPPRAGEKEEKIGCNIIFFCSVFISNGNASKLSVESRVISSLLTFFSFFHVNKMLSCIYIS
jgi:hypothetical protein